jgi:hypothetical protein
MAHCLLTVQRLVGVAPAVIHLPLLALLLVVVVLMVAVLMLLCYAALQIAQQRPKQSNAMGRFPFPLVSIAAAGCAGAQALCSLSAV